MGKKVQSSVREFTVYVITKTSQYKLLLQEISYELQP